MKLKTIALVAHDSRKKELLEWAEYNKNKLYNYLLCATGTTGRMLQEIQLENGDTLEVKPLLSGPLGGDQQIGALIAEGNIDMLIFFCDNLAVQGHQNDVSALSRLASLYNIPFATNRTTADMLLTSSLLSDEEYIPKKPSFNSYLNRKI
jgi:methylglyoxal synthase